MKHWEIEPVSPIGHTRCAQLPPNSPSISEVKIGLLNLDRHGGDAVIEAARMIDRMLDHGDCDGQRVWQLRRAIEALQAPASGPPH